MKPHARILLGLIIGAVVGVAARRLEWLATAVNWIAPAGTLFIQLITMVVVPLVIAGLFVGVASLGDIRRLGRIGGRTLLYFLATTALAAVIGVAIAIVAGAGAAVSPAAPAPPSGGIGERTIPTLWDTIVQMVPPNPIGAAARGDLLPVIFSVVLFAAAATTLSEPRRRPLVEFCQAANDLCLVVIQWLMVLAPAAVAILIASTVLHSGADVLQNLLTYSVIVVIALIAHAVFVLVPILRLIARVRLRVFAAAAGDALLLAFSTAASSVTLPVSLAAAQTRLGVSPEVANFVLPTGTTLNKNGAAVYKAVTAVFLARLYGVHLDAAVVMTIIVATIVASSAGAGVPGSSLVTTMIVLNAIGLGANASAGIALVAGIDRPLDMCRTAVNTFSNLVGTAVIARSQGEQLKEA